MVQVVGIQPRGRQGTKNPAQLLAYLAMQGTQASAAMALTSSPGLFQFPHQKANLQMAG